MKKSGASQGESASELISKRIAELGDWRGETLGRMRKLIKEADPDVVEEWKWMGPPVWSHYTFLLYGVRFCRRGTVARGRPAQWVRLPRSSRAAGASTGFDSRTAFSHSLRDR